jgi:hypothetical protein
VSHSRDLNVLDEHLATSGLRIGVVVHPVSATTRHLAVGVIGRHRGDVTPRLAIAEDVVQSSDVLVGDLLAVDGVHGVVRRAVNDEDLNRQSAKKDIRMARSWVYILLERERCYPQPGRPLDLD